MAKSPIREAIRLLRYAVPDYRAEGDSKTAKEFAAAADALEQLINNPTGAQIASVAKAARTYRVALLPGGCASVVGPEEPAEFRESVAEAVRELRGLNARAVLFALGAEG